MKNALNCYIRPHRRRWALSQPELARLLGYNSGSIVSRLEGTKREPSLSAAFACEVIFGVPVHELFPALFAKVEDETIARAYDLYEELQGRPSKANKLKLDLFEAAFRRAKARGRKKTI